MDTSEIYIKQSEKAGEIQRGKHYPVTMGQRIIFWENDVFAQINLASANWKIVWLPRQDQLQEMLEDYRPLVIEERFHQWFIEEGADWSRSWEQLWLAFAMKEKFGKTWNGEDWD